MIVKFCVALGLTPLLAVILTAKGDPVMLRGVPLMTPVVAFKVAQEGNPVAEYVGAGKPVAVIVKLPGKPTLKVIVLALVIVGATGAPGVIARR